MNADSPDSKSIRRIGSGSQGNPADPDVDLENPERANVRRLIRWVAAFIAWPSLSAGLAFLVFTDPSEHWLHIAGLVPLGLAACVMFVLAPQLARRFVPGTP